MKRNYLRLREYAHYVSQVCRSKFTFSLVQRITLHTESVSQPLNRREINHWFDCDKQPSRFEPAKEVRQNAFQRETMVQNRERDNDVNRARLHILNKAQNR